MGHVSRLVGAFLRRSWTDTLLLALLLVLLNVALVGRADTTRGWAWFDLVRLAVIVIVAGGAFFSSRISLILPVSKAALWRARWWVATAGTTLLAAIARLVAQFIFLHHFGRCCGPMEFREDAVLAAVDALTAGACMGCAALVLRPRGPAEPRWRWRVLRWTALLVGATLPIWCPSLRTHVVRGDVTLMSLDADVLAAIAVLAVVGFVLAPRLFLVEDRHAVVSVKNPAANVARVTRTRVLSTRRAGGGARAWAAREISFALSNGIGAVIASGLGLGLAVAAGSLAGPWWQGTVALYLPSQLLAPILPTVLAFFWAKRVAAKVSMLRQVPIPIWTIVAVLTVGPLVVLASGWGIEAITFRTIFGAWPSPVRLAVLHALITVLMLAKTVGLVIDSTSTTGIVGVVLAIAVSRFLPLDLGPGAAAATALGLAVCLMWIDVQILTRARRVYHARVAVA